MTEKKDISVSIFHAGYFADPIDRQLDPVLIYAAVVALNINSEKKRNTLKTPVRKPIAGVLASLKVVSPCMAA